MKKGKLRMSTKTLVTGAILTALVVILQFMGAFIRFGPFSISLVLIPIVIGAAICGVGISTWLGFIFGVVVLLSGDAAAFMVVDILGTIVTVLVKGTLCGFFAGATFKFVIKLLAANANRQLKVMKNVYGVGECCENGAMEYLVRNHRYVAVLAAAVICPMVNTGIFLLGCLLFFRDTVGQWAVAAGFSGDVGHYMIFGLVGANFLFELLFNLVLSPIVVRIVRARKKL